jgi:hypothetical protein
MGLLPGGFLRSRDLRSRGRGRRRGVWCYLGIEIPSHKKKNNNESGKGDHYGVYPAFFVISGETGIEVKVLLRCTKRITLNFFPLGFYVIPKLTCKRKGSIDCTIFVIVKDTYILADFSNMLSYKVDHIAIVPMIIKVENHFALAVIFINVLLAFIKEVDNMRRFFM